MAAQKEQPTLPPKPPTPPEDKQTVPPLPPSEVKSPESIELADLKDELKKLIVGAYGDAADKAMEEGLAAPIEKALTQYGEIIDNYLEGVKNVLKWLGIQEELEDPDEMFEAIARKLDLYAEEMVNLQDLLKLAGQSPATPIELVDKVIPNPFNPSASIGYKGNIEDAERPMNAAGLRWAGPDIDNCGHLNAGYLGGICLINSQACPYMGGNQQTCSVYVTKAQLLAQRPY